MQSAKKIIDQIANFAPPECAMDGDNSGLQIGDISQKVANVLLTLDINYDVLKEAVNKDCQMIVSHHPLIYRPLKKISKATEQGNIILQAAKRGITIYSAHTNLDIAGGGLNDYLAKILKLQNVSPLVQTQKKNYYKIVVFVPISHFKKVRRAILDVGAGCAGNYSHSSFSVKGQGSFKPLSGSDPFEGEKNEFTEVQEYRLETIVSEDKLTLVKEKIFSVHPYEEIALDVYSLKNSLQEWGLGRIGSLKQELKLEKFLAIIKDKLDVCNLRFVGDKSDYIKQVALCSGSGGDYIKDAASRDADIYISGDIKYHQAQQAEKLNICLVDAGHYGTEKIVKELLFEKLSAAFSEINFEKSEINTNPWSNFTN